MNPLHTCTQVAPAGTTQTDRRACMAAISGEGYISNKVNQAGTYYMFLVIDGVKQRKSTGTKDEHDAAEKLEQWKVEVKTVFNDETHLICGTIRDAYLA